MRDFLLKEIPSRIRKTVLSFLSTAGVTWGVITWLVATGRLTVQFSEYALFTVGIIGIKSFKPKDKIPGGQDGKE